jgi:hypothetical protein
VTALRRPPNSTQKTILKITMKTKLASILVLAAACAALSSTSLTAAPNQPTALAFRVSTADFNGWEITRGMKAKKVINRCGAPDAKLSANVWVYQRFHAVPNQSEARECTTLVVTFVEGIVSDLHLVNDRAQTIIAARVQSGETTIVATAE